MNEPDKVRSMTVSISDAMYWDIRELADEFKVSRSEIVRKALDLSNWDSVREWMEERHGQLTAPTAWDVG